MTTKTYYRPSCWIFTIWRFLISMFSDSTQTKSIVRFSMLYSLIYFPFHSSASPGLEYSNRFLNRELKTGNVWAKQFALICSAWLELSFAQFSNFAFSGHFSNVLDYPSNIAGTFENAYWVCRFPTLLFPQLQCRFPKHFSKWLCVQVEEIFLWSCTCIHCVCLSLKTRFWSWSRQFQPDFGSTGAMHAFGKVWTRSLKPFCKQ